MRNLLIIQLAIGSLLSSFGLWLAVRLIDTESTSNSYLKALLFCIPVAFFIPRGFYGILTSLGYIAILAFAFYELEPVQSFGVILFWGIYMVLISLILKGIVWVAGIF